jgi:hypothetical protein
MKSLETAINTNPDSKLVPSPPTNWTFSTPEEAIEWINSFTGLHGPVVSQICSTGVKKILSVQIAGMIWNQQVASGRDTKMLLYLDKRQVNQASSIDDLNRIIPY